jgi:S-DNA-T family DNA segregation ATPase FtsK/SpoIIIE
MYALKYFGFLAYIYLPLLAYPIYKVTTKRYYLEDIYLNTTAIVLFSITLLLLQSLLLGVGEVGNIVINSLSPYIGKLGCWIVTAISAVVTFFLSIDGKVLIALQRVKMKLQSKRKVKPKTKFENKADRKSIDNKLPHGNISRQEKPSPQEIREVVKSIEEDISTVSKSKNIDESEPFDKSVYHSSKESDATNETKKIQEYELEIEDNSSSKDENETEKAHKSNVKIVDELEENKKLLAEVEQSDVQEKPKDFKLPKSDFFQKGSKVKNKMSETVIDQKIEDLLDKLLRFKIEGDVVRTYTGPVVTTFEFKPAPNVKVSKILNLQDDLAMALKAKTIRIQAPIPGKDVVGIEVPNEELETIYIRDILESEIFKKSSSPLTMILGLDIVGQPFVTDLKKLPHLLIAGTTGSGKSVGINSMIISLLYKNSPDNLRLMMIDPKMLEFSMYNDIPHLLTPVITKPQEAINALSNMVGEMERRYSLMSKTKTKNIENYNEKAKKDGFDPFPYIVVIIDELADLMMTSGKDVELSIARLAQMARASGIHLIVATQRPSVDVVTGLIKANLPSRISYKVGQKVDSKIILDSLGAESLLGRGDMLFTPPGISGLVRLHAPWSKEDEIERVVEFLKEQRDVEYDKRFLEDSEAKSSSQGESIGELDELYEDAKSVVLNDRKTSISYIQRKLKIGYNRAASIVEQLEHTGVLSAPNSKGNREIL